MPLIYYLSPFHISHKTRIANNITKLYDKSIQLVLKKKISNNQKEHILNSIFHEILKNKNYKSIRKFIK